MSKVRDTITLYCQEGSSDKFYIISVVDDEINGGSCTVPFVYGRRGTAGKAGEKVSEPVSYVNAKKIFDSTVAEKMAKGYTVGEGMKPYAGTSNAERVTGIHCQLLTEVREDDVDRLIKDDSLVAQEKFNGRRMLIRVKGGKATAVNRAGLECGFPSEIEKDVLEIAESTGDILLDGECVGTTYHAFDVLELKGKDLRDQGVEYRLGKLNAIGDCFEHVCRVVTARKAADKRSLYHAIRAWDGEGIVFKLGTDTYRAGVTETWIKVKFWDSCSCLVTKVNTKRSVAMGLLDERGNVVDVGNCTIPASHDIPKKGDVIEVRYLYAHKGGSIYQPQYEGLRDDIERSACLMSQLKYKPEGSDDE